MDITFVVKWVRLEDGHVLYSVRDVLSDPEVVPWMEQVEDQVTGIERAPLYLDEVEACEVAANEISDGGSDELIRMAVQALQKQGRW